MPGTYPQHPQLAPFNGKGWTLLDQQIPGQPGLEVFGADGQLVGETNLPDTNAAQQINDEIRYLEQSAASQPGNNDLALKLDFTAANQSYLIHNNPLGDSAEYPSGTTTPVPTIPPGGAQLLTPQASAIPPQALPQDSTPQFSFSTSSTPQSPYGQPAQASGVNWLAIGVIVFVLFLLFRR